VATAIASLFNDDDAKQEEIENLQRRIDQLQWELDNQDAVRLQNRLGDAVERVRNVYIQTTAEVMRLHEVSKRYGAFWVQMVGHVIYENEVMERSIMKIADAYATVEYTANKALGKDKYMDSRKQLENLAEQQILIYRQIEEEQDKKDVDQDKNDDWKRDIQELANEMADLINEMLEEIIGSTAQDLSSELGKAFFDAAAQGEDAMEAWHQKVNDIVRDILQRMLISQVLEPRIGQLFDKYKKRWFDDKGNFQGIDAVKNSASQFASDLNQAGELMREMWDGLSEDMKQYFSPEEVGREAAARGIATASQDSVDENNARLTTIQGHTYTLVQGVNDLNDTANAILDRVTSIDRTTQNMDRTMDETKKVIKNLKDSVDDMNMKGIKLK
jgi:methyl-accepting chemotaxis protein